MIGRLLPCIGTLAVAAALTRPGAAQPADLAAAFDEIHATVAGHFLDPDLGGLDWDAVGRDHRDRAAAAGSLDAFGTVVNEMLGLLETSHTRLFTGREPAYYQLLAIFEPYLGETVRTAHPENPGLHYPGIGLFTTMVGDDRFVSGVLEGWPAADAGLRVGDRIIAVDGAPFHPLESLEGRVGRTVTFEIQRTQDPSSRTDVAVEPVLIDPAELFLRAMERSIRVIEHGPTRVGYVHLWSCAGPRYQELLESQLESGALHGADALILDLRDGWGGASPRDLNLFNRAVPTMTHITREGTRREIDSQWRRPVALLVNGGSRSGKEVVAHGFRAHGIGPVVGTTTAGAVVGGRPFLIRPGILLYLAVVDVEIDGERLEGVGVAPDVPVPFEMPYANGADPQLEAALESMLDAVSGPTAGRARPAPAAP